MDGLIISRICGMNLIVGILTWPSSDVRVDYLEECLLGIRKGLINVEYRVVISAETDCGRSDPNLVKRVEGLCRRYNTSSVSWRSEEFANQGNNLNCLIDLCLMNGADYIFLLDDDCILRGHLCLHSAIELLEYQEIVTGVFWPCYGPNRGIKFESAGKLNGDWDIMALSNRYIAHSSQFLVRKDFIDHIGCYIEDQQHGEPEREMNERLKKMKAVIAFKPAVHFEHIGSVRANGTICQ